MEQNNPLSGARGRALPVHYTSRHEPGIRVTLGQERGGQALRGARGRPLPVQSIPTMPPGVSSSLSRGNPHAAGVMTMRRTELEQSTVSDVASAKRVSEFIAQLSHGDAWLCLGLNVIANYEEGSLNSAVTHPMAYAVTSTVVDAALAAIPGANIGAGASAVAPYVKEGVGILKARMRELEVAIDALSPEDRYLKALHLNAMAEYDKARRAGQAVVLVGEAYDGAVQHLHEAAYQAVVPTSATFPSQELKRYVSVSTGLEPSALAGATGKTVGVLRLSTQKLSEANGHRIAPFPKLPLLSTEHHTRHKVFGRWLRNHAADLTQKLERLYDTYQKLSNADVYALGPQLEHCHQQLTTLQGELSTFTQELECKNADECRFAAPVSHTIAAISTTLETLRNSLQEVQGDYASLIRFIENRREAHLQTLRNR